MGELALDTVIPPPQPQPQLQLAGDELIRRLATKEDLDEITQIAQAGFPDDPEFDYRFPYRHKYPEDNWKWTRHEYEGYLEQPLKFAVLVVTAPVPMLGSTSGRLVHRPVALAVWDMAVLTDSTSGDEGITERRDANPAHMKEFAAALGRGFDRHFAAYGREQIHLWLLATHPDFRRRGAGTMLCNWGRERAVERSWMLTVLASPMGTLLYQGLGYKNVGSVIVQVDGEKEKLEVDCLELDPSNNT